MPAREFTCKVTSKIWLTPTVVELRFEPSRRFKFEPGHFVSVVVPPPAGVKKPLRRAYSLSAAPEDGYALCVKIVPGGKGSNYVASLNVGDSFKIFASYGELVFNRESPRGVCFISTGTGLAPFMAMMSWKEFRQNPPPHAYSLFGARTEEELIQPGRFKVLGVQEIHAVSQPGPGFQGFKGRVTDYLNSLPASWPWQQTDFYLCGNGAMVSDVRQILRGRGIPDAHIYQEVYFVAPVVKLVVPPPMRHKKVA